MIILSRKILKKTSNLFTIFLVLLFVFFAVGFYTFYNAKGTSYLSNASESCNNCHVVNEVYNEYMAGPHSQKVKGEPRATCVDCHMPYVREGAKKVTHHKQSEDYLKAQVLDIQNSVAHDQRTTEYAIVSLIMDTKKLRDELGNMEKFQSDGKANAKKLAKI